MNRKLHINQKANMSVFNGTKYEGMTYLQVRRTLTPEQVQKMANLTKRNKAVRLTAKAEKRALYAR